MNYRVREHHCNMRQNKYKKNKYKAHHKIDMKNWTILLSLVLALVVLSSCSRVPEKKEVILADQYGLAYAPLDIMRHNGYLEDALKAAKLDVEVVWKKLPNTAAMREAMLADELDFGFVGIPPFLIGKDKGMDWRIMVGLSESPLGLVAPKETDSLETIREDQRIILPQPGSIQHILLSMYAEQELGDAKAFDTKLVSMSHPDGLLAMTNNQTDLLHFTSPPYLNQELDQENFRLLVDGETCFGGEFTFIVGICPERVYEDRELYQAVESAIRRSIAFMKASPDKAYEILLEKYSASELEALKYMTYSEEVKGLSRFIEFMNDQEIIQNQYEEEALKWQ